MTLDELISWARTATMTPAQLTKQRRSFAYGNCKIENDRVTHEMVAEADRRIHGERQDSK
jgi:hypothetical protein